VSAAIFAALLIAALWIIFGLRRANEYQLFYLLFIPVVWIAVRAGYAGVSLALPVVHLLIVRIATMLGYADYDFIAFQMLMLVLSATGLLLGAAVTEARSSAERIRRQETELARATRQALVGATGTAVAHEISQPLAATTNYIHAARRMLFASDGDRRAEAAAALAKAETEARRVRETLERVREYVASGRLQLSDVDLEAVIAKIVSVISHDALERSVRIETRTRPYLPTVRGDAIQLEQLLLNLIWNAVDAASSMVSGVVTVNCLQRGDRLVIEVEDTGPGVSATVADRLFEPFESTKHNGMGLGLTLVRQIVDSHAGALTWSNLSSGGARFSVELRIDGPQR
jgi:C4-dicarboxylate-specific signal transduction histidine kinase